MWYLAIELWPYVAGAFTIGAVTGWLSGCVPRRPGRAADSEVTS